jgi:hypothetical protein
MLPTVYVYGVDMVLTVNRVKLPSTGLTSSSFKWRSVVLFAVGNEFLNNIWTSFGFKKA